MMLDTKASFCRHCSHDPDSSSLHDDEPMLTVRSSDHWSETQRLSLRSTAVISFCSLHVWLSRPCLVFQPLACSRLVLLSSLFHQTTTVQRTGQNRGMNLSTWAINYIHAVGLCWATQPCGVMFSLSRGSHGKSRNSKENSHNCRMMSIYADVTQ